jgi:RHS repeat-associated protein
LAAEYGSASEEVGTRYLTADHLGSTRVMTDSQGAVRERHDYEPFGRALEVSGSNPRVGVIGYLVDGVKLRFTGKERDSETGLDWFGARYFSGAQGRWTSPDLPFADQHPANPQSWNLYSYTLNNPLRYYDPNGRGVKEGLKKGIDSIGVGMITLALQPDRVAAGAWNAVSHPGRTIHGIGAGLKSFWHSSLDEKVTSVVSFAVPAVLGGGAGALGAGSARTATTLEGAQSYTSQATQAFGDGPFSFVSTTIPTDAITPEMQVTVDRGVSTVVVPADTLPKLTPPQVVKRPNN